MYSKWSTVSVCVAVCVCACVVALNHLRFISSVTTSQTLWRAIMLYQQINDLAITGHNWLWNTGSNILSISLLLFKRPCPGLCCCIMRELYLPPICLLFLFPISSPPSSEHFPGEASFPLSLAWGIWKTGRLRLPPSRSIIPMFIQLSALSTGPPPSVFPSFCPAHLPLYACHLSALKPQLHLSQCHIFQFLSISLQLFFSPTPSCLMPDAFSSYISSLPWSVFVLEDAVSFVLHEDG